MPTSRARCLTWFIEECIEIVFRKNILKFDRSSTWISWSIFFPKKMMTSLLKLWLPNDQLSYHLTSCHVPTCKSFGKTNIFIVFFTRANCVISLHMKCLHMDHDLVEVRYTHVRDSIYHCTTHYASILHGKYYFLPPQRWIEPPRHSALHSVHSWNVWNWKKCCAANHWGAGSKSHWHPTINIALNFLHMGCALIMKQIWPINHTTPQMCTIVDINIASSN